MNKNHRKAIRLALILAIGATLFSGCGNILNAAFKDQLGSQKIIIGTVSVYAASTRTWVKLTWAPIDGASSYDVYRGSSESTANMKKIGSTTQPSYTDSTANASTTYFYSVKAVNSIGSSPYSTPVPCTTGRELYVNLTATATTSAPIARIALSWTLNETNPTATVVTYIVYRGSSNVTSAMSELTRTTDTTFDDEPPTGANYFYAVKVSIPGYEGDFSTVKAASY